MTVSEGERPQKIFESINATGVGLSQSDLLRHYLFMALGERSNSVSALHWRPLEVKLDTNGLEGWVRDDLQSSGEFVKQNEVYGAARGRLEPVAGDFDELEQRVKPLARRGAYYALFLHPRRLARRRQPARPRHAARCATWPSCVWGTGQHLSAAAAPPRRTRRRPRHPRAGGVVPRSA